MERDQARRDRPKQRCVRQDESTVKVEAATKQGIQKPKLGIVTGGRTECSRRVHKTNDSR